MDWKKQLKAHQLRATAARLAVLRLLAGAEKPLTIQEIMRHLADDGVACDMVTVYRMTEAFMSRGLVKQVNFEDGSLRYEIEGEHHHHLVCEGCGAVQAIHEPCVAIDATRVSNKYQFDITRHTLEFFGLCWRCTGR